MTQNPKRPPSVWISQIILVIYVVIILGALAMVLMSPLGSANFRGQPAVIITLIGFLLFGGIAAVFIAAFWGLVKRRPWGQWLTAGILALIVGVSILQTLGSLFSGNAPAAYRTGQLFGSMVIIVPFIYLIYRLGFGDAAKDFFNPPDEPAEMFEPPPPPTFTE